MTQPSGQSGAIHDIGYRHYDGDRLPSRYAMRALAVEGLRGAFGFGRSAKAKVMPLLLLGFLTFVALVIAAMAAVGNLEELDVRPAPFVSFMLSVVAIFVASQAPQLVSRDLRFRTVSLYFSRPLKREEYLAAKAFAMTGAVVLFLGIPVTVLTAGALLAEVPTLHALGDWAKGIAAALIAAIIFGAIALVIAAITPRRGLGVAAIIAVFMVSAGFAAALTGLGIEQDVALLADYARLLSPHTLVDQVVMFVTRVPRDEQTSLPDTTVGLVYLSTAVLLVAVCYLLLVRRYRKVSVT